MALPALNVRRISLIVLLVVILSHFGYASSMASSQTASSTSLVKVSRAGPFPQCQSGNSLGKNYLNDVVEPSVALGRATTVGVWQQDRWSNGGAHGIIASASRNGGKTWHNSIIPFSMCASAGLHFARADDPWVSIGPDGTVYALAMVSDYGSAGHSSIGAAVSSDGGTTWNHVQAIDGRNLISHFYDDKDTITADPLHRGTAYAVWRRVPPDNVSPLVFSKTADGGAHWSKPRVILSPGGQVLGGIGGQIAVDPKTGMLFNAFLDAIKPSASRPVELWVAMMTSRDRGNTWSKPLLLYQSHELLKPSSLVRAESAPVVAYDAKHGRVDVVWNDPRYNHDRYDGVAFTSSSDGVHWSSPLRIDSTAGQMAFDPMIAATSGGTVGLTYYQIRRALPGKNRWLTDYWMRFSVDGGKTFEKPQRISGPFDITNAPIVQGGYFVGDYEGLAANQQSFAVLFVQTKHQSTAPSDVYATMIQR